MLPEPPSARSPLRTALLRSGRITKASAKREQALRYFPPLLGLANAPALITGALTLLPSGLDDFWSLILVTAALRILLVGAGVVGTAIGQQILGDRLEVATKSHGTRWRQRPN